MMEKSTGEQNREGTEDKGARSKSVVIELDPTEQAGKQYPDLKQPNAKVTEESASNGVSFREDKDQKGQKAMYNQRTAIKGIQTRTDRTLVLA